jgi:type IV secretory pathway VirB10-like protein
MTDIDKLERLNSLREKGALSEQEFEQQKTRLLSPTPQIPAARIWFVLVALGIALATGITLLLSQPEQKEQSSAVTSEASTATVAPDDESIPAPTPSQTPVAKNVDPPVPRSAAPEPTNADYYNEAKRDMMRAYRDQPAGIREMLGDYAGANTLCRGSSDAATVEKWCPIRDALSDKLQNLGMCYGRPTDRSAADSEWHTCDERDAE